MHLNKDNLYEQHVEFEHAVEILCDNIKDYDIEKVKLVRCQAHFYNTDPCMIHIICCINPSL
jgi:hypothetical protein